jgi:predicted DNA-binding protein (MmcQ/YjbR family)
MAQRTRKRASMTREDVLDFCIGLAGALEDYPFGDEVAVFKLGGPDVRPRVTRGRARLREPQMRSRSRPRAARPSCGSPARVPRQQAPWNSVDLDGTIAADDLTEMIEHSYELVVAGLPRSVRADLQRG